MRTQIRSLMVAMIFAILLISVPVTGDAVFNDSAYSWWMYPNIERSGKNGNYYFGCVSSNGTLAVCMYNPVSGKQTRQRLDNFAQDDHSAPAVSVLSDGRIMAAYTGHSKKYLTICVTKKPGNLTSWNKKIVLDSPYHLTYAQIFHYKGTTFIFYRQKRSATDWRWVYRKSEDLKNWSDEIDIVKADEQYYCMFRPTTSSKRLRIVMTANPQYSQVDFRQGFFDLSTESVFNSNNRTRLKKGEGAAAVSYKKFNIVVKKERGKTQRLFDVAVTAPGTLNLAYCTFDRSWTTATYKALISGKTYKIGSSDRKFWETYYGGASFIGKYTLAVSYAKKGVDYLDKFKIKNGTVKKTGKIAKQIISGNRRLIRPFSDPDRSVLMWQNGYYDPSSFSNYKLSTVIRLLN